MEQKNLVKFSSHKIGSTENYAKITIILNLYIMYTACPEYWKQILIIKI